MLKLKNILIVVVVALVAIAVGYKLNSTQNYSTGTAGQGVPSGFDNVNLWGGLQVGVSEGNPNVMPVYGVGSIWASGAIVSSSTAYIQGGGVTTGGLCTLSAASTTNTVYLTVSNLACSTLSVTTGTTTVALSVVMPASSTISTNLFAGDVRSLNIYAASTTGGNLIISATTTAGFSMNSPLGIASTTAATTTISAGEIGILNYTRLPTTDIYGGILPYK